MGKRILILGASGMLGSLLFRRLPVHGFEVIGTTRQSNVVGAGKLVQDVDIRNLSRLDTLVAEIKPDVTINCIGIIRQLLEGQDPVSCITLNSLFPHQLYAIATKHRSRLVHISTDCVFSGHKGGKYFESDTSDASDMYGKSKYLGELHGPNAVTLRTSIIGHEIRNKLSLVEWFLSQKTKVRGYTKAIYTGLTTVDFSNLLAEKVLPNAEISGLYHVSSEPISKYELLQLIKKTYGLNIEIEPYDIVSEDKSMDSSRFRETIKWKPRPWPEMIKSMYEDYQEMKRAEK